MTYEIITTDPEGMVFVFGSNLSGIHGAGAARAALRIYGAIWGIGEGHQGNSYALPTKGENITDMMPSEIQQSVYNFIEYADDHPELDFQVTAVGTGMANHTHERIAAMFETAPLNCFFDTKWYKFLGDEKAYWGTF